MFTPTPYGWISQYFIGFFFAYGVYLPFWALWFEEQGVSPTDIGLLVGIGFCLGPIIPLSDAMANYYSRLKMLDYGRTRLWGSLAFIAGSTVVGMLVARYGTDMILYTALAGTSHHVRVTSRTTKIDRAAA